MKPRKLYGSNGTVVDRIGDRWFVNKEKTGAVVWNGNLSWFDDEESAIAAARAIPFPPDEYVRFNGVTINPDNRTVDLETHPPIRGSIPLPPPPPNRALCGGVETPESIAQRQAWEGFTQSSSWRIKPAEFHVSGPFVFQYNEYMKDLMSVEPPAINSGLSPIRLDTVGMLRELDDAVRKSTEVRYRLPAKVPIRRRVEYVVLAVLVVVYAVQHFI